MIEKEIVAIRQLCCLGIDGQQLVPILLPEIRKLIPAYSSTFLWANDQHKFTNFFDESPDSTAYADAYLNGFLDNKDREARPSLSDWLRTNSGVTTSERFMFQDFTRSGFYNEILRPLKYHHELIVGLKDGHHPLGILFIHRSLQDRNYSAEEENTLRRIAPYLVHGISHREPSQKTAESFTKSGMLVFDCAKNLVHIDSHGQQLLFLVANPTVSSDTFKRASSSDIPREILALCNPLTDLVSSQVNRDMSSAVPVWRHNNAWGAFTFRAHLVRPYANIVEPQIIVLCHYHEPVQAKFLRTCHDLCLTQKQINVATHLLMSGSSYTEIADRINVSVNTVIHHTQNIFTKVGVNNRIDFMQKFSS